MGDFLSSVTGAVVIGGAVLYGIYSGILFALPSPFPTIILALSVLVLWAFLTDKNLIAGRALK